MWQVKIHQEIKGPRCGSITSSGQGGESHLSRRLDLYSPLAAKTASPPTVQHHVIKSPPRQPLQG